MSCTTMRMDKNLGSCTAGDDITNVNFDILDDDDDILMETEDVTFHEEIEETGNETEVGLDGINFDEEMEVDEAANISIGVISDESGTSHCCEDSGFDFSAGKLWIYPTNFPIRDYQYNIVQQGLYKNTLVVLPTGLGKTFIAAVVMYNFFRWFPRGKIVFMAPTKPLVAQQIQACYSIMGIPKSSTVEMTGTMPPAARQQAWREKRVVFLTPQVMTNDLSRGSVTADSIKCLVLDEAHKALGNHAYCQVVRELVRFTREFRILALSATPGGDIKAVQQVMNNLMISHIELRSEESIDIRPYTHERKVEKIVVPLGEELSGIRVKYIQIMTCTVQKLIRNRVLYNREATKLSKFLLLKARDEFRQNPPQNLQQAQYGNIEADFAMAISLYHGFELLQLHGLRSLYNFMTGIIAGEKGYGRTRSELLRNADFNDIMETLREKFLGSGTHGTSSSDDNTVVVVGHPKMQRLEEIVVDHFRTFKKNGEETRVMIFSQYRDSVQEIATILNRHQPLVRVMPFIGQSSAGKTTKGYTQKEQLMVMKQFREGGYNTLVSTCVGEEGLDIGDVDLIVCFDAHKSPIRLVQRMGRTGRKRQGRIVMLVTEGKEEQIYNQSLYSKKSIHKAILNGARSLHFYQSNPRMVPPSVSPQCHKMYITLTPESNKSATTSSKSKGPLRNKSRKISDIFGKQGKKVAESEYLTSEEYAQISKEFAEVSTIAKFLPRPRCFTLESLKEKPQNTSQLIDFAEWMPWQNRLQTTHIVGHSIQSVHLVQTSEFIQLQQCIGDDKDSYGLEMDKILKKDMKSGEECRDRQNSIRSFLTNVQDTSCSEQRRKSPSSSDMRKLQGKMLTHQHRKEKGKCGAKNKKQRIISANAEPIVIGSDSSLDGMCGEVAVNTENKNPIMSKLFTELGDKRLDKPGTDFIAQEERTDTSEVGNSCSRPAAKNKAGTNRKNKPSGAVRKGMIATSNLKRKSVLKLLESNCDSIPSTKDSDDFETGCLGCQRNADQSEKFNTAIRVMPGNVDRAKDDETLEIDIVPNIDGNAKFSHKTTGKPEKKDSDASKCVDAASLITETYCIPKPPSKSGIRDLFQSLKSMKEFAELDLEKLVEQWNTIGKIVYKTPIGHHNDSSTAENSSSLVMTGNQSSVCDAPHETEISRHVCVNIGRAASIEDSQIICKGSMSDMGQFSLTDSWESLNEPARTTRDVESGKAEHSSSKSPLFKSLTCYNKQRNKYSAVKKNISFKEAHSSEIKETLKTMRDPDSLNVTNHSINSFRQHVQNTSSSSIQMSVQKINKTSSPAEHGIHRNMPNSFPIKLNEIQVNMDASIKKTVSPCKFNDSFVTFTQALDLLQMSSSEEALEAFGTPSCHVSPSKDSVSYVNSKCGTGVIANENRQPKSKSVGSIPMNHQNLRSGLVDSECAVPKFRHNDERMTHPTSAIGNEAKPLNFPLRISPQHPRSNINLHSENIYSVTADTSSSTSFIETPAAKSNRQNNLDLPQFDLGFDLEDGDDDVIPPTPPKNLSQDSVFGLKSLLSSKNCLQDTASSATVDKSSVGSDESGSACVNKPYTIRENKSQPLEGSSKMNPLLDRNTDTAGFAVESLQHCVSTSKPCEKNQQNADILQEDTLYNLSSKFDMESLPEKNGAPSHDTQSTYHKASLLFVEVEEDKFETSPSNSPLPSKGPQLPFNRYSNAFVEEHSTSNSDLINPAEGQESHSKISPEFCTKIRAGKLMLSRRGHLFHKLVAQNDEPKVDDIDDKNKTCKTLQSENYKTTLDENSDHSTDSDAADYSDRHLFENLNSTFSQEKRKTSLSSLATGTDSFCRTKEPEYPMNDNRPSDFTDIKTSTPVRDTPGDRRPVRSLVTDKEDKYKLMSDEAHDSSNQEDPEDSFIIRRRKPLVVLEVSSDDDAGKEISPVKLEGIEKANELSLKQTDPSSSKFLNKPVTDEKEHISIFDNFDDDMDDFEGNHSVVIQPKQHIRSKNIQKKKSKMGAEFLEKEAEVSGEETSSDESENMDDFYEASFIDNNTEMTQGADMRAVYLKSVKSPCLNGQAGRFKMQFNAKGDLDRDIYSQSLSEDQGMSEYEEDSFCVGNDEDDISYVENETQLSIVQKKHRKAKAKEPRKRKRRIKMKLDSSSDDEKHMHTQSTQEFGAHPCVNGRRVLFSSSEDERENMRGSKPSEMSHSASRLRRGSRKDECSSEVVRMEGLNLVQVTDDCQATGQVVGPSRASVVNQQDTVTDVGNFDLFEEADWFDDFDLLEVNSGTKDTVSVPVKENKHETVTGCFDSKIVNMENTVSDVNDKTRNQVLNTENAIYSQHYHQSDTDLKSQAASVSLWPAFSSLCDNSKNHFTKNCGSDGFSFHEEQSSRKHSGEFMSVSSASQEASSVQYVTGLFRDRPSSSTDLQQNTQSNLEPPRQVLTVTREERLRRQREKQEMYRNKLKQVKQISGHTGQPVADDSSLVTVEENVDMIMHPAEACSTYTVQDADLIQNDKTSPVYTKITLYDLTLSHDLKLLTIPENLHYQMETKRLGHQLQILVDTREISGAQEIISVLRLKHGIAVTARQLSSCDYILSNHLAVDRVNWSTFSNSSYRSKLSSRLCEMQALYERCVLVVEADRVKAGKEKSKRPIHRTKYLDTILSYLAQSAVKVYFTDTVEETAILLADLCHVEERKGRAIAVPAHLSSTKEEVFSFILSIPRVTVPQALNLTHRFQSVAELLSSSASIIQERGCMTLDSALAVHKFLRHQFDIQMMPNTKS